MTRKGFAAVILTAAVTSLSTFYLAGKLTDQKPYFAQGPSAKNLPVNYHFAGGPSGGAAPVDFQVAAESSVRAAVHIRTTSRAKAVSSDPYSDWFGNMFGLPRDYMRPQQGSGSGVVISQDGYIVTNNHVVSGADEVSVTFSDRSTLTATVVGSDPATDIAVVKVDRKGLPFMEFGNSDDVHLGQWVLAVGYPLTLDATVTAGIVSAKSRAIGINRTQSKSAIESFIQTDAAVNPGNSGGALVNTSGQLIGINSAIASPTGSYAGYSYAIPANLVRKVVNDLVQYGSFQRGYLGISYLDRSALSAKTADSMGLSSQSGVYINSVSDDGGAKAAGLRAGDFITAINGVPINTEPELVEQIARYKPGDVLSVSYSRKGNISTANVQLKNASGSTDIMKPGSAGKAIGATVRPLSAAEKSRYGVDAGVVVENPGSGLLGTQTSIRKGFIITSINDEPVSSPAEVDQLATLSNGSLQIAGFYPGSKGVYYYSIRGANDSPSRSE